MNVGAENADGPTIKVSESEEGLEAATVNIYSGNITIYSSDDCINAANKELSDYSFAINISGGKIWAYSSGGDGFDSNGTIDISGGSVTVWTANTADDQPLDADGKITISGGTVLAAGGSSGMGMNLSSSQGYLLFGNSGGMGGFGGGMQQPNGGNMQTPPDMNGNSSDGNMTSPDMNNNSGENATSAGTSDGGFAETAKSDNGMQGGGMQKPSDGNMPTAPDGSTDGNMPTPPNGTDGNMTPPDGTDGGNTFPGGGLNASVAKGSTLSITDASGNTLFSEETPCNVSFVFFTSSEIAENGEYSLLADGTETLTATGSTGETSSSFTPGGSRDFPQNTGKNFNVLYVIIPVAAFLVGGGISALVILLCTKKKKKNKAEKAEKTAAETGLAEEKTEVSVSSEEKPEEIISGETTAETEEEPASENKE